MEQWLAVCCRLAGILSVRAEIFLTSVLLTQAALPSHHTAGRGHRPMAPVAASPVQQVAHVTSSRLPESRRYKRNFRSLPSCRPQPSSTARYAQLSRAILINTIVVDATCYLTSRRDQYLWHASKATFIGRPDCSLSVLQVVEDRAVQVHVSKQSGGLGLGPFWPVQAESRCSKPV